MDAGEAAGEDRRGRRGSGAPSRRARGSSLRRSCGRRSRTQRLAGLAVVLGDVGERLRLAGQLVLALAGRAGVGVDRAEEQVAGDVLEVAAVLQPRPAAEMWSVVHLPWAFIEHRQPEVVLAVPRRERLEQLQAVAGRADLDLDARAVVGRSRERVLAGVVAAGREHLADRRVERDLGAVGRGQRVGRRVEVEPAGERQRHHRVGRRDEAQRVGRAVVALREVAVVRVDDRVRLAGDALGARPLADARAAGVGEHGGADGLEVGEQAVALDRRPDLLGARRDQQLGLRPSGPSPTPGGRSRRRG